MNKQLFIKAVEFVIELEREERNLSKAFKAYGGESSLMSFVTNHPARIVKWLEESLNDKSSVIAWWLWDCPARGEGDDESCTIISNEKKYLIKSIGDLYDYLVESTHET